MTTKKDLELKISDLERKLASAEADKTSKKMLADLGEVLFSRTHEGAKVKFHSHRRRGYHCSIQKDGKTGTRRVSSPDEGHVLMEQMRARPEDFL